MSRSTPGDRDDVAVQLADAFEPDGGGPAARSSSGARTRRTGAMGRQSSVPACGRTVPAGVERRPSSGNPARGRCDTSHGRSHRSPRIAALAPCWAPSSHSRATPPTVSVMTPTPPAQPPAAPPPASPPGRISRAPVIVVVLFFVVAVTLVLIGAQLSLPPPPDVTIDRAGHRGRAATHDRDHARLPFDPTPWSSWCRARRCASRVQRGHDGPRAGAR